MSTLKVDTLVAADGSSAVTLTKQEAAKSYLWYDQQVPEIDTSFNISSVTDHSAGQFTQNFTNNFSTATYVWLVGGQDSRVHGVNPTSGYVTSSTTRFATRVANTASLADLPNNTIATLGDLA